MVIYDTALAHLGVLGERLETPTKATDARLWSVLAAPDSTLWVSNQGKVGTVAAVVPLLYSSYFVRLSHLDIVVWAMSGQPDAAVPMQPSRRSPTTMERE